MLSRSVSSRKKYFMAKHYSYLQTIYRDDFEVKRKRNVAI